MRMTVPRAAYQILTIRTGVQDRHGTQNPPDELTSQRDLIFAAREDPGDPDHRDRTFFERQRWSPG